MPEAVWFPAPRRVEIREEPRRPVGPGDIRVRAVVSGISAGSELLVYRGEAPRDLPPDLPSIGGDFGFPVKFGYASVGRILEAGAAVEALAPNDLVFAYHPHQTELVMPADQAVPLPKGLPPELGIFAANLETAVTVVLDARPRLAEAVLITGQGVVGLLITMLLKRVGARPVVAVDLHAGRREAAKRAGADVVLEPGEAVPGRIRELTSGRGVDVAIDASGSAAGLQTCIDAAAFSGTIVAASWYGSNDVSLSLGGNFHRKRLQLLSSQVSTIDPVVSGRWDRARRSGLVAELLCDLQLASLVTHRFAFRDAAAAYRLLDQHPADCLQVVLDYG